MKRETSSRIPASSSPTIRPLPVQRKICCTASRLRQGRRASDNFSLSGAPRIASTGRPGARVAMVFAFLYLHPYRRGRLIGYWCPILLSTFIIRPLRFSCNHGETVLDVVASLMGAMVLRPRLLLSSHSRKRPVGFGLTNHILRRNSTIVTSKHITL